MRYDTSQKERTRARVLKAAARAIRAGGPERVAVAGVMAEAGLTHGGFYAHFASKDELIAAAIDAAFADALRQFAALTDGKPPGAALVAYVDFYLSPAHRDQPERGCPLPSLAADLPRLAPAARRAFGSGLAGVIDAMASLLSALGHVDAVPLATSIVSELAGALALSRAVADRTRSNAILAASHAAIAQRLSPASSKRAGRVDPRMARYGVPRRVSRNPASD